MKAKLPTPQNLSLSEIMDRFHTDLAAREYLEAIRWPNGPVCPHCNNHEKPIWTVKANAQSKVREGLRECSVCKLQFTVTVNTIFEDSKIPLRKWLVAWYLLCSSKKGISALQIQRTLGLGSYRTAWMMMHKIRYALKDPVFFEKLSGTVEVDETYIGGKPRPQRGVVRRPGPRGTKAPVVALVERGGNVRTLAVPNVTHKNIDQFIHEGICKSAVVNTDEAQIYRPLFKPWKEHQKVFHGVKEYARTNKDGSISHVNTCESFFSLIKRGVYGAFHHVSREHLHRYCDEFSFRWNHRIITDGERMVEGLKRTEGKRLTYKPLINGLQPKTEPPKI
jgi:transposase-like protein